MYYGCMKTPEVKRTASEHRVSQNTEHLAVWKSVNYTVWRFSTYIRYLSWRLNMAVKEL